MHSLIRTFKELFDRFNSVVTTSMLHPFNVTDRVWSWTGDKDFPAGFLSSFFAVETPFELVSFLLETVDNTLFEPLAFFFGAGAVLAPVVGGEWKI
jgi:hypothetical protein